MESNRSMSHSEREFYLPGSAIRSAVPGRVERFLTNLLRDHSGLEWTPAADAPVREFYRPATLRR